jgi:hypothetical protein
MPETFFALFCSGLKARFLGVREATANDLRDEAGAQEPPCTAYLYCMYQPGRQYPPAHDVVQALPWAHDVCEAGRQPPQRQAVQLRVGAPAGTREDEQPPEADGKSGKKTELEL